MEIGSFHFKEKSGYQNHFQSKGRLIFFGSKGSRDEAVR